MKTVRLCIFFCLALVQHALAQLPVAEFTANRTSGCDPLSVTFRDQSTGDPKFWSWDFGNGEFSNLQNPTIAYTRAGSYTITLVVRNENGTHGITKTNFITVNPSPVAGFIADHTIGCIPATIRFTDRSSTAVGTITAWEWDFGDGTTSNQQHPQKTYTEPGFYSISLRITSSTGCQAVRSIGRYIRIVSGVTADFDFTPPATCRPPYSVNFSNLTSGPGDLTYQWDFGNSTGSTQQAPTATYAAAGTFNVTLTTRSEFGCIGTITKPVAINGIVTNFTAPAAACLNVPVTFPNASSATPLSSTWDFDNGSTSDQRDGTTTFVTPGTYSVKLVNVYDGCEDSVRKSIVVPAQPLVNFTGTNLRACQGPLNASFRNASPDAVSWLWDFGDGTTSTDQHPTHQYISEGQYNVRLTITTRNGCVNSLTRPAFVRIIRPVVRISNAPNGGCAPYTFRAVPNVTAIDGVASYTWDFGNGVTHTSSTPAVPPVTYTTPGIYRLSLQITTTGGCVETLVLPAGIRVGTPPTGAFSMSSSDECAASNVQFTDLTPVPVDEWRWDFGDGQTSTAQNPRYRYSDTGRFTVRLTPYNNRCAGTPASRSIHIKPPIGAFTYNISCADQSRVSFINTSKINIYEPVSYLWNFGDPAIPNSTLHTPPLVDYPTVGDHTVTLTVRNGGCTYVIARTIHLMNTRAAFTISKNDPCKNEEVTFTSTNDAASVRSYAWSVNGAPFVTGTSTFTTSFPNAGVYNISLRITDINGCENTSAGSPVTVSGPMANFTIPDPGVCRNAPVAFNDLSLPAGGITQWKFDFGDGQTIPFTGAPFNHTYADTGKFVVRLTVADARGCTHTFESPDTVHITQPVPGFTANFTTICPRTDVQFTDTSAGIGLSWQWDFGDGQSSTDQNPVHAYIENGKTYNVTLVITDVEGCQQSVVKNNYITTTAPQPAFDVDDTVGICPPLETKFTFLGQHYESYYWDFGDGSTSSLPDPTHFYNDYGKYTAKLYLVGYGGCLDSIADTINVYNPYTSTNIAYTAPPTCDSMTVDFTITTPPATQFTFFFGDGSNDNTQAKRLRHAYRTPNFYAPFLLLKDAQDCQVQIGGSSTIRVIGAQVLFGMDKDKFCDSGVVYFTDYTRPRQDPIRTRTWTFGDGTTSNETNPIYRFRQPGAYLVRLTTTTVAGCTSFMQDSVLIYRTPSPVILGEDFTCVNDILPLEASLIVPDTAITWKWNLGGGGNPPAGPQASAVWPQPGTYQVQLEASNKLGCKNDTTKSILVPAPPVINVTNEPVIPVGSGINLPVTYGPEVVSYLWTPAANLSCTDCPSPYANPRFTTKYNVLATDQYGCTTNRDITVTVTCNDKNYFVPNTFSPNGDGHNDVFYPRGSSITRISSLKIFNRWGELIYQRRDFSANDASAGWNGLYKGKPANQDVYIYIIEFICENAAIVPIRGDVMLMR